MNNENDQSRVCYLFYGEKMHMILVATNNVRELHSFELFE
jgi:hypothetical protein